MKSILTGILSLFIFFGAVPQVNAMDMNNMAGMEEIKKKKKGKKKMKSSKGKKVTFHRSLTTCSHCIKWISKF